MYLVSACLVGANCRYDGTSTIDTGLDNLVKSGKAIIICPEVLGGLEIPREPCEIVRQEDGLYKVLSKTGNDYTDFFIRGAYKTLEICKISEIDTAILKARSPSCGMGKIYDGTFKGNLIDGNGLTAKLLSDNGIKVFNEQNWLENFE